MMRQFQVQKRAGRSFIYWQSIAAKNKSEAMQLLAQQYQGYPEVKIEDEHVIVTNGLGQISEFLITEN